MRIKNRSDPRSNYITKLEKCQPFQVDLCLKIRGQDLDKWDDRNVNANYRDEGVLWQGLQGMVS